MICAELEELENELDDLIVALEDPELTAGRRKELEELYASMSKRIQKHQAAGHKGGPCFEE